MRRAVPSSLALVVALTMVVAMVTSGALTAAAPAAATADTAPAAAVESAVAVAEEALRQGETQIAESRYRGALAAGWLTLGRLAEAEGDPAAARRAFERAAGATVENRAAIIALALTALELGQAEEAVQRLQGRLGADPDDVEIRRLLAQVLAAAGRRDEALQELEEARTLAPDDAELTFTLASAELAAGRLAAAAERFDELVRQRPIARTWVLIGRTYRDARHYQEATTALRRALAIDPRVPHAHLYLATLHLLAEGNSELAEAAAELEQELAVVPDDPLAQLYLGMVAVADRRYAEAVGPLRTAAADAGTEMQARQHLGRALLGLDRPREAAEELRRALELLQARRDASLDDLRGLHYQLALALRALGDRQAAAEHFAAAEATSAQATESSRDWLDRYLHDELAGDGAAAPRLDTGGLAELPAAERSELSERVRRALTRSYLNLGVLEVRKQRFQRAAGLLAVAAELAPDFPGVQRSLGVARFSAGSRAAAVAPLERALAASPDDADLRRLLALARLDNRDYAGAADLLAADPSRESDASLQYAYGLALVRSGRSEQAGRIFAGMVERHGDSAPLQVLLGEAAAQQDDYETAAGFFHRALELDPGVAGAHAALGLIDLRRGELAAAESALRAELDAHPDDLRSRFHLATVLDLEDRGGQAIEELRTVLAGRPDDADARYLLGKVLLAAGDAEAALPQLEAAAGLAPDDANVRYQLGRAYQAAGRAEDAREQFAVFRELKDRRREATP